MKEIEDMGYYISRIMEVVSQMRSYDECITNRNRLLRKFVTSRYVFSTEVSWNQNEKKLQRLPLISKADQEDSYITLIKRRI